jgi:probable HAF family extracellular repeat protein
MIDGLTRRVIWMALMMSVQVQTARAQTAGFAIDAVTLQPTAVNASGQVVGYSSSTNGQIHAFLYSAGQLIDLGTLPGGNYSEANGINSSGQVVGYSTVASGSSHAFLYSGGQMTDLGTLPRGFSSVATGINDAGLIVGYSDTRPLGYTYPQPDHAFVYSNGTMTDIGSLGTIFAVFSHAVAINSTGQIVGWSNKDDGSGPHAFLYSGGQMSDLGTLGGSVSHALAINSAGQIVGSSYTSGDILTHAFLYSGGTMADIGTVAGYNSSYATGINSLGEIVGYTYGGSGTPPFIYTAATGMTDINTLISNSNWHVSYAYGVNDAGQIICVGSDFADSLNNCLLTPIKPAQSVLRALGYSASGGFNFSFSVVSNKTHVVQWSTNFPTWNSLTNVVNPTNTISITDRATTNNYPRRFYRIQLQ